MGKLKRIFDFLAASVLLILLSWLMVLIFILVKIFLGSPALFKQARVGYQERIFTVYKFRTMSTQTDKNGNLLADDQRLRSFGKFLRASSLDELPQLFNILKGDMSFIGPRPLLIDYLPLYNPEQKRRHAVRPGISGWAQVNGRNAISWQDKFKLDCWYVDHQSFLLDLKIIGLTIKRIVKPQGISQEGKATMEKFDGTN